MASLPVDISILEDQVIEVTEMEDAMEECMMFVKKLSETSLTEMEKEKLKLQELLQKAEKEMKNMKHALKRSCCKRDEWRDKCLMERDGKMFVERQLKETKQRIQKLETAMEEHKNALKQHKTRSAEVVKDLKEKLGFQKTVKLQMEDKLCQVQNNLKELNEKNEELQKQLFDKTQEKIQNDSEYEDQIQTLKTQISQEKTNHETVEDERNEQVCRLQEKLAEGQEINKKLSIEAEAHVLELEEKLKRSEEQVKNLTKFNDDLSAKLTKVSNDSEKFDARLEKVLSEKAIQCSERDTRIDELLDELKKTKESMKDNEAQTDIQAKESKTFPVQSKSWANIVDEEQLHELQEKYNKLLEEQSVIQRQFAHLKKHRNQVLRENNELHYHVQMATLQLASGNTRFRQQMDQFRIRLQIAESMYEEKVMECNMLDSQLKQMYGGEVYAGDIVYAGPGYV